VKKVETAIENSGQWPVVRKRGGAEPATDEF
jgi:hypothetical protein